MFLFVHARWLLPIIALCFCTISTAFAQGYYSTLVGTVRDPAGSVVPEALVTATEILTGVSTSTLSNAEGEYRMATLRPGEYSVSVAKEGFKGKVVSGFTLLVAQTTRIDLPLELGTVAEKVMVTETAPLVQTETAERGGIVQRQEVEALPLNTRNVGELTYLVPGAIKSSSYFEPMPSVNGLGAGANQMNVDGNALTSSYMMIPAERISIDTVEEFKVETANTTADHGMLAGSTISIATRHGTNTFHGTAFEFLRNDFFNARNFFAAKVPPLRYNDFGANVGGPVLKNRLFFFFNYEGNRERRAMILNTTVPTPAELAGNFNPGTGVKNAAIFDPLTADTNGQRLPFADNQVPQSRWNPVARKYLPLWPQPNTAGFPNYFLVAPSINDYTRYAGRIDFNLSSKDSFLFRTGYQTNPQLAPGPLPGAGTGTTSDLLNGRQLGITWNHVVSPRSLNTARFSYSKLLQSQVPTDFTGQNLSKEFGYENGDRILPVGWGLPGISFGGVPTRGPGGGAIWTFPNRTYNFSDDFTFSRGQHTFKTGLLHQRYGIDTVYARAGGVSSGFTGRFTAQIGDLTGGQPFADFLLGSLAGVSIEENPQISPDRRNFWQAYFQDDWKATSKLTLQLGIRYDINLPGYLPDGRAGAWLDGLDKRNGQVFVLPANGKDVLAEVLKGQPLGFPYRFSDNNWLSLPEWGNVGPRIGIAYRPFGDTRTVIRGGYGIYYNVVISTIQNNRNYGRPFQSYSSTPPRPVAFEPPPYNLGDAPVISPYFKPGEPFRSGYVASSHWPDQRVQQWNLTVQRDLGHRFAVEAAYVGNHSTRGLTVNTWNQTFPVGYTFRYDDGSTFTINPDTPLLQRKKYPDLGTGTSSWPWVWSTYHSGQFQLIKQMSEGIQFRAGYTRSRLVGMGGTYQSEWDVQNLQYYLAGDLPNIFFFTYVWQLPGQRLRGPASFVIGGWQLAGIVSIQSGPRVNPAESFPQFDGAGGTVEPIMLHDPNLPSSKRTLNQWFDTGAFAQPGPNQLGSDSAIYSIRAPATRNFDLSLSKFFKITENHKIQFRGEFFNLFNHPTFGAPSVSRGTATFGRVTSAGPAREIQVALKYQF